MLVSEVHYYVGTKFWGACDVDLVGYGFGYEHSASVFGVIIEFEGFGLFPVAAVVYGDVYFVVDGGDLEAHGCLTVPEAVASYFA